MSLKFKEITKLCNTVQIPMAGSLRMAWLCSSAALCHSQYITDKLSTHEGGISEVSSFTRCTKSYIRRNTCDSRLYLLLCFGKFGYIP